jgi:uncharacterized protein (TIGR02217 family)
MAFIETPRFPENLSYGSQGGPEYLTGIAVLQSGHEQRRSVWASPRHYYNASYAVKTVDDLVQIRDFFHAMKGRFHGFRFKDWNDYTSAADDVAAPDDEDQELGVGDGLEVDFQLRKNYTTGTETLQRPVTKPVAGTTVVAVDGVAQILTTDYTIDETTGIITFVTAPAVAEVVTAGFEFDVPCRFDIDQLSVNADTWGIRSTDIPIIELRSP